MGATKEPIIRERGEDVADWSAEIFTLFFVLGYGSVVTLEGVQYEKGNQLGYI